MREMILVITMILLAMMFSGIYMYERENKKIDWFLLFYGVFTFLRFHIKVSNALRRKIMLEKKVSKFSLAALKLVWYINIELIPNLFRLYFQILIDAQKVVENAEDRSEVTKYKNEKARHFDNITYA